MKVTVLNHTREGIVVHRVGCADITRAKKYGMVNSDWPIDISTSSDISTAVADDLNASFGYPETYGDDEAPPWSAADIRIMPCVKRS